MNKTLNPEIADCLSKFHNNIAYIYGTTDVLSSYTSITPDKIQLSLDYDNALFDKFYKEEVQFFYINLISKLAPTDVEYFVYWIKRFNQEFDGIKNDLNDLLMFSDISDALGTISVASIYSTNETIKLNDNTQYNKGALNPFTKGKLFDYALSLESDLSFKSNIGFTDNIKFISNNSSSMVANGDNLVKDRQEIDIYYTPIALSIYSDIAALYTTMLPVVSYFANISNIEPYNPFSSSNKQQLNYDVITQTISNGTQKLTLLRQNILTALKEKSNLDYYPIQ